MKYSVIIPTLNAGSGFQDLLQDLHAQLPSSSEILVVDSSSTDGTAETALRMGVRVEVIDRKTFNHGTTRNQALRLTHGEVIVFLTQDIILEGQTTIGSLLAAFTDKTCAAAYGRQLPHRNASVFASCLRAFNYPAQSHIRSYADRLQVGFKAAFLSNSFAAYRRSALDSVGNFKDGIIFGEDSDACARLLREGFTVHYVAESRVFHSHDYSIMAEFRRYFDIGVFHRLENHLLEEFGKPESAGVKYVLGEMRYLKNNKRWFLMPLAIVRNGAKFIGYRVGRRYESLPLWACRALSMHTGWWTTKPAEYSAEAFATSNTLASHSDSNATHLA